MSDASAGASILDETVTRPGFAKASATKLSETLVRPAAAPAPPGLDEERAAARSSVDSGALHETIAGAGPRTRASPGLSVELTRDHGASISVAQTLASSRSDAGRQTIPPGSLIGRYIVLRTLGAGAMGVVFEAIDPELDRKVALKLLRADVDGSGQSASSDARTRLVREAQALARLSHPNVVGIFDVGTHDDQVWIAMELVVGRTLRSWFEEGGHGWREVLEVMEAAGRGLAAAHAAGLVHRDIKPDNVMLGDYGLVRVLWPSRSRIPKFYRPRSRIDPGSTQFRGDHSRSSRPASGCLGCITAALGPPSIHAL